jgi:hypothetical protein
MVSGQYHEGESAASFCCQEAALFPDMFCYFYFGENHKVAKHLTTTKAKENNKHIFGILRIIDNF